MPRQSKYRSQWYRDSLRMVLRPVMTPEDYDLLDKRYLNNATLEELEVLYELKFGSKPKAPYKRQASRGRSETDITLALWDKWGLMGAPLRMVQPQP